MTGDRCGLPQSPGVQSQVVHDDEDPCRVHQRSGEMLNERLTGSIHISLRLDQPVGPGFGRASSNQDRAFGFERVFELPCDLIQHEKPGVVPCRLVLGTGVTDPHHDTFFATTRRTPRPASAP